MPTKKQVAPQKGLKEIVAGVGHYPGDAYEFLQHGLSFTVQRVHGDGRPETGTRHVDGRQLCLGLRDFALAQWGFLARTVLERWNVTCTLDFGRMVFAMVEAGHMSKTEQDCLDDFADVFDFESAFECGYRIETSVAF